VPETLARGQDLTLRFGMKTDVGLKRRVNEDSCLASAPVFIVADGMGGHSAGDLASQATIAAFQPLAKRQDIWFEDIEDCLLQAHRSVSELSAQAPRGAGSTVAGAIIVADGHAPEWVFFNVGDSRVYRLSGTDLEQITRDHSIVQERVDRGELSPNEAFGYEGRNVITRAVGAEHSSADFIRRPVVHGERIMICSDGVCGLLSHEALRAGLILNGGPQETANLLISQALAAGGSDNATVIVVDVLAGGLVVDDEMSTTQALFIQRGIERSVEVSAVSEDFDDTHEIRPRSRRG
jgi:serine/threonine protein phosphatase PrpC